MKTTDYAHHIGRYLKSTLPGEIGATARTIDSYKLAFVQFTEFMMANSVKPEDITLGQLTREMVLKFLDWLEKEKGNSVPTRNQKLAAIKGFTKYLRVECPEHLEECIGILSIPAKKYTHKPISYLTGDGVKALASQVNQHAKDGLRDLLMLALLSCLGLRASELAGLKVKDIQLGSPPRLMVYGKGGKIRPVPILEAVLKTLKAYLKAYDIDLVRDGEEPLFKNHLRGKFTRQGIHFLVKKYADKARESNPDLIPADLSPHKLRHTTAMELLASGVDLIYIRDLLGHSSVTTTEIYAKANSKLKLQALEKATREIGSPEEPKWVGDKALMDWLKSL